MCKIMNRTKKKKKNLNDINKKEENLSNVYNFKNDFNLDLKSSRVPAFTISFDKLFQWLTTLIKKMFKSVNFLRF